MAPPKRQWKEVELRRMKAAVESGVLPTVIGRRFKCRPDTVIGFAKRLGWRLPSDLQPQRRGGTLKPPPTKPGQRAAFFQKPKRPAFTPTDNGCPVRVLKGEEFERRKRELEARDRSERAGQDIRA